MIDDESRCVFGIRISSFHSSFVIFLMEILHSISDLAHWTVLFSSRSVLSTACTSVIKRSSLLLRGMLILRDGTPVVVTFDPHPAKVLRPEQPPHLITSTPHKIAFIRALGVGHLLIIPFDKDFAQTEAEDFVVQLDRERQAAARDLCRS